MKKIRSWSLSWPVSGPAAPDARLLGTASVVADDSAPGPDDLTVTGLCPA